MTLTGLSIDRDNGDYSGVCKEGNYSRTMKPQGVTRPTPIAISLHHLFVICNYQHSIYKLDKVSGDILFRDETNYYIRGLSIDTDTLYAGMYELIAYLISVLRI